jgi:branched-chain amino acid transport system substrate-binding protein
VYGQKEVVKIGFIGPLSGDAAIIGEESLKGVQLAVDQLNSKSDDIEFELTVKDDMLDDKETITQYRQLVDVQGVDYILTPTYGAFFSLAKQAEQDAVILMNPLDASEELADLGYTTFAIGIYDEGIGYAIADHLTKEDVKEVGLVMNLEDPFILLVADAFKQKFKGKVQEESYTFDTKDFRTTLTKLSSYEYIVLLGWEETGLVVKQAKELGMDTQFIGIDTFASEDFKKNSGYQHEGLLFTFWKGSEQSQIYKGMLSSYKAKYAKDPESVLFVATGYDAMSVLGKAITECSDEVECAADLLRYKLKDFQGATGSISIDPDGITRSIQETIFTYRDSEIVALE